MWKAEPCLPSGICIQVYIITASSASFGSDHHYSIGCTHTINSSGSIFQYGDTFNIIWCEVIELAFILLDTINNIQWCTHIPDLDIGRGAGAAIGHTKCYPG